MTVGISLYAECVTANSAWF